MLHLAIAMSRVTDTLSQRQQSLQDQGADPLRIELLRRARRFKRSWIDMADALLEVKQRAAYQAWGYETLYAYCEQELMINKRTVDKLTGSYSTLREHAPELLERADDAPIPSYDAVDYFRRVVDKPDSAPDDEVVRDLRAAVFEQGAPLSDIRKQFNPVFFAKTNEDVALEALMKAQRMAGQLEQLLADLDGLSAARVREVTTALAALRKDLDELIPEARAQAEMSRAA